MSLDSCCLFRACRMQIYVVGYNYQFYDHYYHHVFNFFMDVCFLLVLDDFEFLDMCGQVYGCTGGYVFVNGVELFGGRV